MSINEEIIDILNGEISFNEGIRATQVETATKEISNLIISVLQKAILIHEDIYYEQKLTQTIPPNTNLSHQRGFIEGLKFAKSLFVRNQNEL